MANLFATITDAGWPARRAYGTIFGNHGRRMAVIAAAEAYFGRYWDYPEVRSSLTDITNAIQYASKLRDDIVHGIAETGTFYDVGMAKQDMGTFLLPPEYNTARTYARPQDDDFFAFSMARYRYTGEDIMMIANNFFALARVVDSYTPTVRKRPDGVIPLIEAMITDGRIVEKKT